VDTSRARNGFGSWLRARVRRGGHDSGHPCISDKEAYEGEKKRHSSSILILGREAHRRDPRLIECVIACLAVDVRRRAARKGRYARESVVTTDRGQRDSKKARNQYAGGEKSGLEGKRRNLTIPQGKIRDPHTRAELKR